MKKILLASLVALVSIEAVAQLRDYKIHKRGMLHETVFNTGEIGRAYDGGTAGSTRGVPAFEWPGNSEVVIDNVHYNGQYNSFGGGMYLAVSRSDTAARLYAHCGGVTEPIAGRYSFPLALERTENYPVLPDGSVNPAFNPDEAEEIVVAKWASSVGLTVTRTSRSWSLPDYDDFIIYEYEIEHTGDTDGDPSTPAFTLPLTDVLVAFQYTLCPSMLGYERTFNRWDGADYAERDQFARFDRQRWMNYNLDRVGRPDPKYFSEWALSQKNGGGLISPQAVGYFPLHIDTVHLAHKGETQVQVRPEDTARVWDANWHLKQPFLNRMETMVMSLGKIQPYMDMSYARKNNPYTSLSAFGADWVGRGSYNWRQSEKFGTGHILIFGPYTMNRGDKIRFAVAEVAGYGAARLAETQGGLKDEGGSCGELCSEATSPPSNAFNPVPNWWQPITYGGFYGNAYTHGSDYLGTYPLPEYVNSDVVTIREVADRAIQIYAGTSLVDHDTSQFWPERAPDHGVYMPPLTVYAPAIHVSSNSQAENLIEWQASLESLTLPRLRGPLSYYRVVRADHPLGPWKLVDSVAVRDPRYYENVGYKVLDRSTRVGESFYYAVVSVDAGGNRSGLTNMILYSTQLGGTESLEEVVVVPNPFVVRSGFAGTTTTGGDPGGKIGFYNLPKQCTIRVISYSGQLVETINHDSGLYSTEYMQVTRNNQLIASGVYFYVVETPDGKRVHGKFVVIH
jgi:hypothetical protein